MDIENLLRLFNVHKVKYVIIGATAFPVHGYARTTLEIDIHPYVKGVTFKTIWKHRMQKKLGRVFANFASLDDLIKMKRAAGRPKDKQDLKALLELKKRKKKR
jgi:predicted nucleotidyltransferase